MPAFDHVVDAAQDLAFTRALIASDPQNGRRFVRRRVAATLWIPGMLSTALLGAQSGSWEIAVSAMIVLVAMLVLFAEGPGRIAAGVRRLF